MLSDKRKTLINLLKQVKNQKILENLELIEIDNNDKELITKGIMFDNKHTCYHDYDKLEDMITSLMVSCNNYGIYLYNEFIGIVSVFYQYYKDLTRLEISLSIKEEYRNNKIGTYCLNCIINNYFENTNIKSIHLSIREDNIKSRKMAENCGFKIYPGYKIDNYFTKEDGIKVKQVQYLLKRKDYY